MSFEKLAELKMQLTPDPKPAKPAKQHKESKVDPIVLVIGRLQKLFPVAFPKNPAPKVPLKVGILDDLIARSVEIRISEEDLKNAIQAWCKSQRYWSVIIEGATRINLDGNPAGNVDATGAMQARAQERKQKKKVINSKQPST